jgi:hypothetical protein
MLVQSLAGQHHPGGVMDALAFDNSPAWGDVPPIAAGRYC